MLISGIDILRISSEITFIWLQKTHWWLINIGSGNDLEPSDNKPLSEPMLTKMSGALGLHQAI